MFTDEMYSGIANGRVLAEELHRHSIHKLISLHFLSFEFYVYLHALLCSLCSDTFAHHMDRFNCSIVVCNPGFASIVSTVNSNVLSVITR